MISQATYRKRRKAISTPIQKGEHPIWPAWCCVCLRIVFGIRFWPPEEGGIRANRHVCDRCVAAEEDR